jgi:murein DD-endopeptidase MepM/ murein hydrolase activator NlpD
LVFSTLFLALVSFSFLSVFSFYSFSQLLKKEQERKELRQTITVLQEKLDKISVENEELKKTVAKLESERKTTLKELARRVKLINSLMKEIGVKEVSEGEGGIALPLDRLLESEEIDFNELVGGIDSLIETFRSTPIGYPTYGRITSDFGLRRNPVTGAVEFHLGVDIANRWGTPVRATGEGRVIKAGWCGAMGKCIEIEHSGGFITYYGHLGKILVKTGDMVERGMVIGLMGNSGRSTGPHLHYSVKYRGKIVNPHIFMGVGGVREKGKG